jgi:hypothetical protein
MCGFHRRVWQGKVSILMDLIQRKLLETAAAFLWPVCRRPGTDGPGFPAA